eukprot:1292771-Rhodomonas_salina.1
MLSEDGQSGILSRARAVLKRACWMLGRHVEAQLCDPAPGPGQHAAADFAHLLQRTFELGCGSSLSFPGVFSSLPSAAA